MAIPNPNTFTNTRIPNSVCPVYNNSVNRKRYSLRRLTDTANPEDYIEIGIRKRYHQYEKSKFRSGLTPGDNGYLNAGGHWATSTDATSRFSLGSPFEWWDGYVIYCYDPINGSGSGLDGLEIYVVNDLPNLVSMTERLIATQSSPYIMQRPFAFPGGSTYSGLFTNDPYVSSNYYVKTPSSPSFNFVNGNNYSIKSLVYILDFSREMTIVSRHTDGGQCDFEIFIISDTSISVTINNYVSFFTVTALPQNSWLEIGAQFYGSPTYSTLNLRVGSTIYNGTTYGSTITNSSIDVVVGCSTWNNPNNYFNGYIDDVSLLNNTTPSLPFGLDFENFANDKKSFTDLTGKVFTIYPDPTLNSWNEYQCLKNLTRNEFLCVNTHYPDITLNPSIPTTGSDEFTENLMLLIDFGFIPCYPRGGDKAYDISGNQQHTMTMHDYVTYKGASVSNCGGGALEFITTGSNHPFGQIDYRPELNDVTNGITINIWIKLYNLSSGPPQYIIRSYDNTISTGYSILEMGGYFVFAYGDGSTENFLTSTYPLSTGVWYNVMFSFVPGGASIIVSDNSSFDLSEDIFAMPGNPIVSNTTSIFTMGAGFNGLISLVSIYNTQLGKQMENLWPAYTGTYPNRYDF